MRSKSRSFKSGLGISEQIPSSYLKKLGLLYTKYPARCSLMQRDWIFLKWPLARNHHQIDIQNPTTKREAMTIAARTIGPWPSNQWTSNNTGNAAVEMSEPPKNITCSWCASLKRTKYSFASSSSSCASDSKMSALKICQDQPSYAKTRSILFQGFCPSEKSTVVSLSATLLATPGSTSGRSLCRSVMQS